MVLSDFDSAVGVVLVPVNADGVCRRKVVNVIGASVMGYVVFAVVIGLSVVVFVVVDDDKDDNDVGTDDENGGRGDDDDDSGGGDEDEDGNDDEKEGEEERYDDEDDEDDDEDDDDDDDDSEDNNVDNGRFEGADDADIGALVEALEFIVEMSAVSLLSDFSLLCVVGGVVVVIIPGLVLDRVAGTVCPVFDVSETSALTFDVVVSGS